MSQNIKKEENFRYQKTDWLIDRGWFLVNERFTLRRLFKQSPKKSDALKCFPQTHLISLQYNYF